ncbi:MAG: M3 family metallopeptidase [Rhodanobacteraceae bacterium]
MRKRMNGHSGRSTTSLHARMACVLLLAVLPPASGTKTEQPDIGIDWNLSAPQVDATCRAGIVTARARVNATEALAADGGTAFAHLLAVENAVGTLSDDLPAPLLFATVAADPALREASVRCNDALNVFTTGLAADPAVYAFARDALTQARTPAERQLARIYAENGRRAGAALPASKRAELVRLRDRLHALESAFVQNLGSDRSTIAISADEARSLPDDLVATFGKTRDGYRVPVTLEGKERFLKNAAAGDLRRRYLDAFYRIGGTANTRRVNQALTLRKHIARLLGFSSWADFQLSATMAKTPARARALLDDIDRQLLPRAKAEIAKLAELKAERGENGPFRAWDYDYYEGQLERTAFAVDSEEVRRYFPADRVVPAMLALYQHLLGVVFERIQPADAWAPDVEQYAIRDAGDRRLLGWFYLDLMPRAGKSLPPSNTTLRAGHALADGGVRLPVSSIIGNGPAAAPGQPALYSHRDLVILFHEFGHLMHATLSTAPYATLNGTNVRSDFVEAPSQMFENWMWQPAILKKISRNIVTGKPIPDTLIDRMVALKIAASGVFWTRQVFLARYDLGLHGARPPVDANRYWFELMPTLTPLPPMRGTMPAASFLPIMGGYDARYYGYAWSRVYAQDMFSVFEKSGIDNAAIGKRYRREVLAPGGTIEPGQLVKNFLGRAPGPQAFYRDLHMRH